MRPLAPADAADLFIARARDAQPLFDAEDGEVAELLDHLDGLPLAIELAAARTKSLPVTEIVDRLGDRFRLLRRTTRGGLARHGGLEAAIDWSYELLFADEQETFQRLAVFPAGATADAVERRVRCRTASTSPAASSTVRCWWPTRPGRRCASACSSRSVPTAAAGCESAGRLDEARDELVAWCIELAELAAAGNVGRRATGVARPPRCRARQHPRRPRPRRRARPRGGAAPPRRR